MSKGSFFKSLHHKKGSLYRIALPAFVTVGTVFLFITGQVIGILFFSIVLGLIGYSPEEISELFNKNDLVKFFASFSVSFVMVGLLVWLLPYVNIPVLSYLKLDKKPDKKLFKSVLSAYGLYLVSFIVIATIGSQLVPSLDVDQKQQLSFSPETVGGTGLLIVFITLVVLPPVTEEILFRGFLYNTLKKVTVKRVAIVVTSVLFSAAHLEFLGDNPLNFIAAIDTFVLSLFIIWVYEKTNNLWAPILLHALKNLIAFVVLFVI